MKIIDANTQIIKMIEASIKKIDCAFVALKSNDVGLLKQNVMKYLQHLESVDILAKDSSYASVLVNFSNTVLTLFAEFKLSGSNKIKDIRLSRQY
jgi:hypothetical protein